jgi:hypothetical protein
MGTPDTVYIEQDVWPSTYSLSGIDISSGSLTFLWVLECHLGDSGERPDIQYFFMKSLNSVDRGRKLPPVVRRILYLADMLPTTSWKMVKKCSFMCCNLIAANPLYAS